ncbi:MAG: glycosyl hydrolase family 28-related protein, partial [Burkholderiaceae bacterium]
MANFLSTLNPFDQFTGQDGLPLDAGFVYIGQPNLDPELSPIQIYWDEAGTIPAAQPLRTINGYIANNGAPSRIYASGNYSLRVRSRDAVQVYFVPDVLLIGTQVPIAGSALADQVDVLKGDALLAVKQPLFGSVGRTQHQKNLDSVSVKDFGAIGNGIANDTAALQAAFDAADSVYIPRGTYIVTGWLDVSRPNMKIYGDGAGSIIKMSWSPGGNLIQPVMGVRSSAAGCELNGFTVDHRAQDIVGANFLPGFMVSNGDAKGTALIFMANLGVIRGVRVDNGWDNGLGLGLFDIATGAQFQGPYGVCVSDCQTSFCGRGAHSWGPAPGGVYFQGAGINALTAVGFNVSNCTDFRSYNGFWCDINGGGSGSFNNCFALETQIGPIWSDAAPGGNQIWNVPDNVFGGNVSGPGAGWRKTPGGLAFYTGSYSVQFNNCVAFKPGLYGFVADYFSVSCSFNNCRVVESGISGMVDAGQLNVWVNPSIEGAGTQSGTTSPSGSICPPVFGFEAVGSISGLTNPRVVNLQVKNKQVYPGEFGATTWQYPVGVRANNGLYGAQVHLNMPRLAAGTIGKYFLELPICQVLNEENTGVQKTIACANAAGVMNIVSEGRQAMQLVQSTAGDCSIVNFDPGRNLDVSQAGNGSVVIGTNGVARARFNSVTAALFGLPTSPAGLSSGELWRDAGAA